jgi:hypothetical protein
MRGGLKGGLPISEETAPSKRAGLSAALAGSEKATPEKLVAVKLKQCSAQAAIQANSSAVFCGLPAGAACMWWSQSGMALDTDISAVDADTAAKPAAAGSVATDRAIITAKMVWAMRCILVVSRNVSRATFYNVYIAQNCRAAALIFIKARNREKAVKKIPKLSILLRKTLLALCAAAVIAVGTIATPTPSHANGAGVAAVVVGAVLATVLVVHVIAHPAYAGEHRRWHHRRHHHRHRHFHG